MTRRDRGMVTLIVARAMLLTARLSVARLSLAMLSMALPSSAGVEASVLRLGAQEVIALPGEDRLLSPDFQELYRVGSLTGDVWDAFGRIGGLGFDGEGNLYILDTQSVRISVVDPQGNLVRQFMGEGEGPGEFAGSYAAALELAVMRDGRVAVYDPGRMGFALFGAEGTFVRTVPLGGPGRQTPMIGGMAAVPGVERVLATTEVRYLSRVRPNPDDEAPPVQHRCVLSYDLGGGEVRIDSVARAWKPPGDPDGRPAGIFPVLRAGVLPDGRVVFTDSTGYAIKVAGRDGSLARILTRPFLPVPVTDQIRASEIERRMDGIDSQPGGAPTEQAMIEFQRGQIESMPFHHEMPVLLALRTSWQGTIWVRRRGEGGAEGNPTDPITADGRYLGTFAPGATALPRAFGPDGLAAFLETDDLDVPFVVVKRLPEGVR